MIGKFTATLGFGLVLAAPAVAQGPPTPDPARMAEMVQRLRTEPALRESLRGTLAPPSTPMPATQAKLDALLKGKEWKALLTALQASDTFDDVLLNMNWERMRIYDGAGILVSLQYMEDTWRAGNALPPNQGKELKDMAVAMGLYSYSLMEVDGARCADPAAQSHRLAQLRRDHPHIWAYAATMPKADIDQAKFLAVMFEAATTQVRGEDEVLCLGPADGSMLELAQGMLASLQSGKPPEPKVVPGQGTVYEYPRAPPKFVAAQAAAPKQDATRKDLPQMFDRWLAVPRGRS